MGHDEMNDGEREHDVWDELKCLWAVCMCVRMIG